MSSVIYQSWSLATLRPDLSKYLDDNPSDFRSREVFCDILRDNGYPEYAERWMWVVGNKRHPKYYYSEPGYEMGWHICNDSDAHVSFHYLGDKVFAQFSNYPRTKCHHFSATRQLAEDALIEFLLRFDTNPFKE